MTKKLNDLFKQLSKDSDYIVSNPNTIEELKKLGLPIITKSKSKEQFLDDLFTEKREIAQSLINELPVLDKRIANATISSLYEEISESFIFGLYGSAITLSVILLELALKYKLYQYRLENDPNYNWDHIEKIEFGHVAKLLFENSLLSEKEKKQLDDFRQKVRNPYIHYNIKKLIADIEISELPIVNTIKQTAVIRRNVRADSESFLWFSAKIFLDKTYAKTYVEFCVNWTNNLLVPKTV